MRSSEHSMNFMTDFFYNFFQNKKKLKIKYICKSLLILLYITFRFVSVSIKNCCVKMSSDKVTQLEFPASVCRPSVLSFFNFVNTESQYPSTPDHVSVVGGVPVSLSRDDSNTSSWTLDNGDVVIRDQDDSMSSQDILLLLNSYDTKEEVEDDDIIEDDSESEEEFILSTVYVGVKHNVVLEPSIKEDNIKEENVLSSISVGNKRRVVHVSPVRDECLRRKHDE